MLLCYLSCLFICRIDTSPRWLWQKASFYEGDEGLKGVMDRYFSKIALWQKASSYEEDEGLKGVIEIQRLLRKVQVKSFMVFYVFMISMSHAFLWDRYLIKAALW